MTLAQICRLIRLAFMLAAGALCLFSIAILLVRPSGEPDLFPVAAALAIAGWTIEPVAKNLGVKDRP